ncbi:MAG: helix-turn-helix transcriptional regulator [Elusimicrobiales bacterium]|nr:helix-turn-helix transcriptional regulator [Elusimicrobiales bacterium]
MKTPKIINFENPLCPINYLTKVLGGRWKLHVLCILNNWGTVRFGKIKKKIGQVSNVMLSQTLKELERDGIVIRHQYNEVPPHVDYALSKKGKDVLSALFSLGDWAEKYMREEKITPACEKCLPDMGKK